MVDAEQAVEPQSNDPILEERQIVVVRNRSGISELIFIDIWDLKTPS